MFKDHHYLSSDINKASRCFVIIWGDKIVGFCASMALPNGNLKNAWRAHRICVLPDYQGMGIGSRIGDAIAQIHINNGLRYYSRTAHPRLINYRENSLLWKPTSKHKKVRKDIKHENIFNNYYADNKRLCGSFEYIGLKEDI